MSEAPITNMEAGKPTTPRWLRIIDSDSFSDNKGEPTFEKFDYTDNLTHFVIATPNISQNNINDLKRICDRDANDHELDFGLSIKGPLEEEKVKQVKYFEFGWGNRFILIEVYPKEFFDSQPNAEEVFQQKILPRVALLNETSSPDSGHK
jgi:hypothetical protein